ncbi:proline racemase family protein [Candidatus Bipolaricaulota bacterium]
MNLPRQVMAIDTHTAGEPTRIWVGGLLNAPGETMAERRIWLRDNADHVRTFLVQEPRGHRGMSGAIVGPPCDPTADIGVIYMDNYRYMPMCGHATIGVVTALVELGHVVPQGIENELVLDTPAGRVPTTYKVRQGKVSEVAFRNVCSYHIVRTSLEIPSLGHVGFDVAYGGNYFVLVSVEQLALRITVANLPQLRDFATNILRAVDSQMALVDPISGDPIRVVWLEFYDETCDPARNVVLGAPVAGDGESLLRCNKVDRSPCGTGLSAKLATLFARGTLKPGDRYRYQSIIETEFSGTIAETCPVGNVIGIVPEICGSAYITGVNTLFAGNEDPFPTGFVLPEG